MKSFFSQLAGVTATLSLLATVQAASNSSTAPSCGVLQYTDDSYFSVVGVQGTGVHPRMEIRELEKDTELWNMYMMALSRFQAMDQREKISYFKIAGIHGFPLGQWDNVAGRKTSHVMGYCPHVSNLFGTWHRPYLALFEQILHDRAVDIANEYPAGEARQNARKIADKVRLTYWDWAVDPPTSEGIMPKCLRSPTATVTFPNGTKGEIANPLYRYDFHPLKAEDFSALKGFEFTEWEHTIRYPLDPHSANATSRNDEINVRLSKQQPNLRDMVYKLLTTYQPFNEVSNKANGGTIGNFETLHDGVHNVFGLGHMGIIEVSAFDPIFWMHHCSMDRLVALYQTRFPDTWIEDSKQAMGTFTFEKGSIQGPDSPLTPFHMNADGDMWTSTTVRNWTAFGYTYPELVGNPSNETFTSTLNKLYKPQTQGLNNTDIHLLPPALRGNETNTTTQATDWLCEVHMPADIKISYSVRAFLGEPNADPRKWPTDSNYVGQLATLSSSRMTTDVIMSGSIGLTEKLAQKHASGELKSLSKPAVAAYLKDNFHWRIQALDFSEIPRNNPPAGLNVTVYSVPIAVPESDTEVPTRSGNVEYNRDIDGKPPIYNGPGIDGTNFTIPAGQSSGQYNFTSGEFEWKNGTSGDSSSTQGVSRTTVSLGASSSAMRSSSASVSSAVPSSSAASSSAIASSSSPVSTTVSSSSSTIASQAPGSTSGASTSASAEAPATTKPADPQTKYVTSIVMQYVTL
ncbi:tyrosinase [Parastagonospora nodorum]|nr:tyrosinase [Parastagonospora nodorum]KAH6430118.1 tyrosinase [Parastagonospora nodorum]